MPAVSMAPACQRTGPASSTRAGAWRPTWGTVRMRNVGPRETMAGMEILVSGAGGFVGGALVPELAGRGHRVRAATRDPGRYRGPAEAEPRRFDLDDAATLE